ncbi:hypothetical protein JRO89_XS08G0040800 [Xanthoceras sorbifolium]|uniref:Uncharacterized protein n=1 Tax=Xanthoceras sorbifolium TaxID=99658 RepID=A0ABQ8HNL0_9ROSI|nr:hypothetical protein JRO89_XS08G0040800 [Xanthoceras sorbifolium]
MAFIVYCVRFEIEMFVNSLKNCTLAVNCKCCLYISYCISSVTLFMNPICKLKICKLSIIVFVLLFMGLFSRKTELSCKGDREKDRGRMKLEEMRELLGKNRIEDVSWLCSLSESELDMLISLKLLVLQRAKIIGHEDLANKFDLKMLRALGLIVMENIKGKVKDLSLIPALAEPALMDCCSLLKCNSKDIMSIEELKACLDIASRKRPAKRYVEAA